MPHKFFDTMKNKNLILTIFSFSLLFFSCGERSLEYKYVVTAMQTHISTTSPKEQKPLLITAISDSDAYIKAYVYFCTAKKLYNIEFQKSGALSGKPLSFKLLNPESIDIVPTVSFVNKERRDKHIEKSIGAYEPRRND